MSRNGTQYAGLAVGLVRERGKMNVTEREYSLWLDARLQSAEILDWQFERHTLRLTESKQKTVLYTPDCFVFEADRSGTFIDVKGGRITEAARLKLKMAATQFPFYRWGS